jgi:hypothetical protein
MVISLPAAVLPIYAPKRKHFTDRLCLRRSRFCRGRRSKRAAEAAPSRWPGRRSYAAGGGGSYLASRFADQVLTAGVNSGDGSISVDLLKAVPEPSTWAMMLAGFAGLGWLARPRGRKTSPA